MKKIVLHGPAVDNAGNYCDAGTELAVGEEAKAGLIAGDRARDLVARGGALSATAERSAAAKGADDFDPAPFSIELAPGGRYTITGPGLDEPEKVKGKAAMRVRVGELITALPPGESRDAADQ